MNTNLNFKFSDQKKKIEKIFNFLVASAFIAGIVVCWATKNLVIGIAALAIGGIVAGVYHSTTEAKKFKTPKDYKNYKALRKKLQEVEERIRQSAQSVQSTQSFQPAQHRQTRATPKASNAPITCPKCGSTQIHAGKRGFKTGRAVGVGLFTFCLGGVIAGAAGKNKVMITCLNCGHTWQAGK